MLNFVFGRAASGKTTYLRNLIRDFVNNTNEVPILIVPEQHSFETEREMLSILGADKMNNVEILSFSRLANKTIEQFTKNQKSSVTEAQKISIMSICLLQLCDTLEVFGNKTHSPELLSQLVNIDTQLHQNCVTPEQLFSASANIDEYNLKQKMKEISLITEVYRAEIEKKFEDTGAQLDNLIKLISENNLFQNRIIIFDSFRGFTAQEMQVFTQLIKRAKAVYISVCSEDFTDESSGFGVFTHTTEFAKNLRIAALQNNVKIAKPAYLSFVPKFNNFPPKQTHPINEALGALEYSLYSPSFEVYSKETKDISLICAVDKADESEIIAREIRRLVREENMRCRDIYIIERTEGTYKPFLMNALSRYGLPVFDDARRKVFNEPIITAVYYAIESIVKGYSTDSIMRYLKTGLTQVDLYDICLVDNYTVLWEISGSKWKDEWKNHPSGFLHSIDDKALEKLKIINDIRIKILNPLQKLKEQTQKANGTEISTAIYNFLIETKMPEKLLAIAQKAEEEGEANAVSRNNEDYDTLISILEQAALLLEDGEVSLKRYSEIFLLLSTNTTLGVIPQGIDEITIGAADRIRTKDARAVFIVGANDGVFPLDPISSGLFSETDMKAMQKAGIEILSPYEYRAAQERFITYCAMTSAREKLYVTYSAQSISGEAIKPSEIVTHIKQSFPNCKKISSNNVLPLEKIESGQSALSVYAMHIFDGSTLTASLNESLSGFKEYEGTLTALENAALKSEISIDDEKAAKELFGKDISLSASRIKKYFECPFAFFCRYGLSIEELHPTKIDSAGSGTIVHHVLEMILKDVGIEQMLLLSEDELREKILKILDEYIESMMGGKKDKSVRFLNLYYKLADTVLAVVLRLKNEFKVGEFVPVDFELYIGGEKMPAYKVPLTETSKVKVTGVVDRVDIMTRGDKKYLRIIDYKTGSQKFNLSDVIQGLDLQMCLYLLALEKNGKARYGNAVPAGVLYLPSRLGISNMQYGRNKSDKEIEKIKMDSGKLSGMILNDVSVLTGMGIGELEGYLPVKVSKKGEISGDLYDAKQFYLLGKKIDDIIKSMGLSLHKGSIPVYPYGKENKSEACTYCEYSSVCGFENGDNVRNVQKYSHKQALRELEEESHDE